MQITSAHEKAHIGKHRQYDADQQQAEGREGGWPPAEARNSKRGGHNSGC